LRCLGGVTASTNGPVVQSITNITADHLHKGSGGEDVVVRNGGDIVVLPKYTFDIIIE
jgi:hypothetical protein